MTELEFTENEFQFIEELKSTKIYQRMKALSKEMNEDEYLLSLSNERDSYLEKADHCNDKKEKQKLLIKFNETDEKLRKTPKMKEYLELYQQLQKVLLRLSDSLTKEIK